MAGVVRLWNKWEVQILVVFSFVLQVFLLMFAVMRRRNISIVPRTLLWLAYLLADLIVIYILGHMSISSKSHEKQQLLAFWAPFLLVHLGGQDTITAYSIEDNQLWPRHLLTFVVQALGVGYVLYKYIAGSWTLVIAAALMFVTGVLKYGERIWALKSSSLDNMSKFLDDRKLREAKRLDEPSRLRAQELGPEEVLQAAHDLLPICMGQFVDYKIWPSAFQSKTIEILYGKGRMYELIEMQLSLVHDFLYTKAVVVFTWCGCFIRATSSVATITAFFLFQSSIGKNGFNRGDVIVTYILIVGAILLELTALLKAMVSTWTCALLLARRWDRLHNIVFSVRRYVKAAEMNRRWSGSIGHPKSLHGIGRGSGGCIREIAKWFGLEYNGGCRHLLKKLHHSYPVISHGTKELVLEEVRRLVLECHGKEDIMRSYSGQCVLSPWHEFFEDPTSRVGIDFDEKILTWYFATKIFLSLPSRVEATQQDDVVEAIRAVSNYMIFLLAERPYMLPSPVRAGSYANSEAAYVEQSDISYVIERIRRREKLDKRRKELDRRREGLDPNNTDVRRDAIELEIIRKELDGITAELDGIRAESHWGPSFPPALAHGSQLVDSLKDMEGRGEREVRRVILGVWVEMLCYAGHHCSRDSHARQLCSGGEFITIVWLLSTAIFNHQYCGEDWFKEGVEGFFKSPRSVVDVALMVHTVNQNLMTCCFRNHREMEMEMSDDAV